jgi:ComF family protein
MARAAYPYHGWVSSALWLLKYGNESDRASALAGHMIDQARLLGAFDMIVPVPLHKRKQDERGYNQSALLATAIGSMLSVPVRPVIVRTRETQSQARLQRGDRQANVDGAFALDPAWALRPGGRYLLIDDVRTTSATLNACADVLRKTSPARVCVLTFALDLQRRELDAWLKERGGG